MAYPIYQGNGGIATGTDTLVVVPYPTTVNVDDILIVALMDADDDSFDTPSGWTKITEQTSDTNLSAAFYWKRATATEGAVVIFTSLLNAGALVAGVMYRYSGCIKQGVPFESLVAGFNASQGVLSTTVAQTNWVGGSVGTTLGGDRLVTYFICIEDDTALTGHFNIVGGNWIENSLLTTADGSDASFLVISEQIPAQVTDSPKEFYYTIGANEYVFGIKIAFIPESDISVALNTADLSTLDPNPILEFTGTDLASHDLEYEVNITTEIPYTEIGTPLNISVGSAYGITYLTSTRIAIVEATNNTLTAYDWTGSTWVKVGNSLTVLGTFAFGLTRLSDTTIAYSDNSEYLATYSFDGTDWSLVGSFLVITEAINSAEIALIDTNRVAIIGRNNPFLIEVYDWNGSIWSKVGSTYQSAQIGQVTRISQLSKNTIAVFTRAYVIQAYVFNGSTWEEKGQAYSIGSIKGDLITQITDNIICLSTYDTGELYTFAFDGNSFHIIGKIGSATAYSVSWEAAMCTVPNLGLVYVYEIDKNIRTYEIPADFINVQFNSTTDLDFVNTVNGGDLQPFNSGDKISYTVDKDYTVSMLFTFVGDATNIGLSSFPARGECITGIGKNVKRVIFELRKTASQTGNLYCEIFLLDGGTTYGTDAIPTGSALATSLPVDITTLSTTRSQVEFTFATPYLLANGTQYFIVLRNDGDGSVYLAYGDDLLNDGNAASENASLVWTSSSFNTYYLKAFDDLVLPDDTYYWKVRAIDPLGINIWSDWSAIRSFDVLGLPTLVVQDGLHLHSLSSILDEYLTQNKILQNGSGVGLIGQSFKGNGSSVKSASFYLKKNGNPTGFANVEIYAHSGTYGTSSIGTGTPLVSGVFDVSILTVTFDWYEIQFDSEFQLLNDVPYVLIINYFGTAGDHFEIGGDGTVLTHSGNVAYKTATSWGSDQTEDLVFKIKGDNISLKGLGVIALTSIDSVHSQTVDNITLSVPIHLIVEESLHSQTVDNVVIAPKNSLIVAKASHTHTTDNVVIVPKYALVLADVLHSHLADNLVLSLSSTLTIQESLHAHISDNVNVTPKYNLTVAEALHTHIVDAVVIVPKYILSTNDAVHSQVTDNVNVNVKYLVTINDSVHSHSADSVIVTVKYTLVTQDSTHSQIADNVVLEAFKVDDSNHVHLSDNTVVTSKYDLVSQDSNHTHLADNSDLVQNFTATVQSSNHLHTSENVIVSFKYSVLPNDSVHSVSSDNAVITGLGVISLVAIDSSHSHLTDNLDLVQNWSLAIDDSLHTLFSDIVVTTIPISAQLPVLFPFNADENGWVLTSDGKSTGAWQSTGGNLLGCWYLDSTGRNNTGTTFIELTTTWEALGISPGSLVTSITLPKVDWRVSFVNVSNGGEIGAFELLDASSVLQGTFFVSEIFTGVTTSWATKNGSTVTVPSGIQASGSTVKFKLSVILNNGNDAAAQTTVLLDNVDFTVNYGGGGTNLTLPIIESFHAHTSEEVILVANESVILVVAESLHSHVSDNTIIVPAYDLVVAKANHDHLADNTVLTSTYNLTVQESTHNHLVENVDISIKFLLVVADSSHTHISESPILTLKYNLAVQDSLHSHSADATVLISDYTLVPNDSIHTQSTDSIDLQEGNIAVVQESLHSHFADNVGLTVGLITLIVADSNHIQTAENVVIQIAYTLVIQESTHNHLADSPVITSDYALVSNDSTHTQITDNLDLQEGNIAVVQESLHSHLADSIVFTTTKYSLVLQDSIHTHKGGFETEFGQPIPNDLTNFKLYEPSLNAVATNLVGYFSGVISSCEFLVRKVGAPQFDIIGIILDNSNNIIEESINTISTTSLGTTDTWVNFEFSGTNYTDIKVGYRRLNDVSSDSSNYLWARTGANIFNGQNRRTGTSWAINVASVYVFKIPIQNIFFHADLIVNDSNHTNTADNLDLQEGNVAIIQESTHNHLADNIVFATTKYSLVLQDSSHTHIGGFLSDIEQLSTNNTSTINASFYGRGQYFSLNDLAPDYIDVKLFKTGLPDLELVAKIYASNGLTNGTPTLLATSTNVIQASSLTGIATDYRFYFDKTKYSQTIAIIIEWQNAILIDISNYIFISRTTTDSYPNGHLMYRALTPQITPTTSYDLYFKLHVGDISFHADLIVDDSNHTNIAESSIVTSDYNLLVQDSSHLHSVESIIVIYKILLIGEITSATTTQSFLNAITQIHAESNGLTTSVGILLGIASLSVSVNSSSSVSATLNGLGVNEGTSQGTTLISGVLSAKGLLNATINASASTIATIGSGSMFATSNGSSVLSGLLNSNLQGSVVVDTTTITSATLTALGLLESVTNAFAYVVGVVGSFAFISGQSNGLATIEGILINNALDGKSYGGATTNGILIAKGSLNGQINTLSVITATLKGKSNISGASNGLTTITSILKGKGLLLGISDGVTTTSASIMSIGALESSIASLTVLAGFLEGVGSIAGSTNGQASTEGILISNAIAGIANGTVTTQGILSAIGLLSGESNGVTELIALLYKRVPIFGTTDGDTVLISVLTQSKAINGVSNGVSTISGILLGIRALDTKCFYEVRYVDHQYLIKYINVNFIVQYSDNTFIITYKCN